MSDEKFLLWAAALVVFVLLGCRAIDAYEGANACPPCPCEVAR